MCFFRLFFIIGDTILGCYDILRTTKKFCLQNREEFLKSIIGETAEFI